MGRRIFVFCIVTAALVLALSPVQAAQAATNSIVVTHLNDSGAGSLRNAIDTAPTGASIRFNPVVFGTAQTILLTGGSLTITHDMTIQGPGADLAAVDGNNAYVVFNTSGSDTVTISGLTIQYGNNTDNGGGVRTTVDSLTLSNDNISNNVPNGVFSDSILMVSYTAFTNN